MPGGLLFGLFILVIHERSHEMFVLLAYPRRSRALNHRIGRLFGVMLFTDYENHWENGRLPHHLHPTDPNRDPQNPDPLDGRRLLARMRWLLLPGGALALNPSRPYPVSLPRLGAGLAIWVGLGALGVKFAGFLELMPSELHAYYVTRGFRAFCAQLAARRSLSPAELRSLIEG